MSTLHRVNVGLDERAYEVLIGPGLLSRAGELLGELIPRRRTVIVTDAHVAALYGEALGAALKASGIACSLIVLPPGEETKSFTWLETLCDRLLEAKLDRGDVIIALGGGVIGDLTGFAAAIFKRGMDFIQIPTTLLSQVDSSVGGKTAIDTARGKNLIGAFHQPRRVLADLDVLASLPLREVRAGYAEVVKYGLLGDLVFFEGLEARVTEVLALESDALGWAVAQSVAMKAQIVMEDERETGRRALLNLGHTFGHALEAETGFGGDLLHGEAVGAGMALAFRFSAAEGLCSRQDAVRAERAIAAGGLPVRMDQAAGAPFRLDALMSHMGQDKKAEGGAITLVLARAIGDAFVQKNVSPERLAAFLASEGAI